MRRLLTITGLALCALLLDAPTSHCARCSPRPCYASNTCYQGCTCMKHGRERRGTCVRFD